MENQSHSQARYSRINKMRKSFAQTPIMVQKAVHLEQKLEKNRTRREMMSSQINLLGISKVDYLSEDESQEDGNTCFKDQYDLGQKIGEGAHGVVKTCYCKDTAQKYAVKVMTLDRQHILFLKRNFIDIKQLSHHNVIGYKALFFQLKKSTCYLVMDFLPYPNLLDLEIQDQNQLKEIVYQILETLIYIHNKKICHRDIKPENILYDQKSKQIKLIDFGISKKLIERGSKRDMLTITGTPYYRAPQMIEGGGYDEQVDIWALGVTIYKLMTRVTPFESEYHSQTNANITKGEFTFPPQTEAKYSKSSRNLVGRLLKKKPQRLTAVQAVKDMWLIDLYKNEDELTRSLTLYTHMRTYDSIDFNASAADPKQFGIGLITTQKEDWKIKQWKQDFFQETTPSMIYGIQEQEPESYTHSGISVGKFKLAGR